MSTCPINGNPSTCPINGNLHCKDEARSWRTLTDGCISFCGAEGRKEERACSYALSLPPHFQVCTFLHTAAGQQPTTLIDALPFAVRRADIIMTRCARSLRSLDRCTDHLRNPLLDGLMVNRNSISLPLIHLHLALQPPQGDTSYQWHIFQNSNS